MTLGQALKEGRQRKDMTLREVERATGISNGYLSLLESDAVRSPSPNHLHKLAGVYGIGYSFLMKLAGYQVPATTTVTTPAELGEMEDLTEGEWAQVRNFAQFLRSSRSDRGQ